MAGGEIMAEADDLVDEEGGRIRRDPPRRGVSQQPELNLGAAGFQSLFEQIDHRAATLAGIACFTGDLIEPRSEEHPSELQSLMRISYAVFCLKKKNNSKTLYQHTTIEATRTPYLRQTADLSILDSPTTIPKTN